MQTVDWTPWLVVGAVLLALIAGWFLHAALGDE